MDEQSLQKLRVVDLRELLSKRSLSTVGSKQILISRLLETEQPALASNEAPVVAAPQQEPSHSLSLSACTTLSEGERVARRMQRFGTGTASLALKEDCRMQMRLLKFSTEPK